MYDHNPDDLSAYVARIKRGEAKKRWKERMQQREESKNIADLKQASIMRKVFYSSSQTDKRKKLAIMNNKNLERWVCNKESS